MGTFRPRLSGMVSILNHLICYSHKPSTFFWKLHFPGFFSHLDMVQKSFFMPVRLKFSLLKWAESFMGRTLDRESVLL